MAYRIESVPTLNSVQDVDWWQQDLRYAIDSFKREVPTVEDCLSDLRELEAICLQDWQGPHPEQRVIGDFYGRISEVCKLWDKIQESLSEMEKRESALEIRHLLRSRYMYPYTARDYGSAIPEAIGLHIVHSWRQGLASLGTWVFGTSPESRRLMRQAALLSYRAGLMRDECAAQEKIQQQNQKVLETLGQVQSSLQQFDQEAAVVAGNVDQATAQVVQVVHAPAQQVSIVFFQTLEQDLRLYCDQPKRQLDQLKEFERQILQEEAEVAALLKKERELEAQLNELEEHRLKAAADTRDALQNQKALVKQVGDRALEIARTPQKQRGSRYERTPVVVIES